MARRDALAKEGAPGKSSDVAAARKNATQESASRNAPAHFLARLHSVAGNFGAGRWLQAKLTVSTPGDAFEREADQVADRVMGTASPSETSSPSGTTSPQAGSQSPESLQRNCDRCEEDEARLQRREAGDGGGGGAIAPAIVHEVLSSPGSPLDGSTRAFMEPRFRRDFSDVRVHTDARAAQSAEAVQARAYAVDRDIVMGANQHGSGQPSERWLMAHELAHVTQQKGNTLARAVAPGYGTITKNLTYGFFDWVITDSEAHQVLTILAGLGASDFRDTLNQMESDGLLTRLLENISDVDETAYAPLIQRIHQSRGVNAIASHIEDLMSYGFLDWAITDAEAHLALQALLSLRPTPAKLRDVVVRIPAKQWERFFDNLPDSDRTQNLRFTQDLEMIRRTGMTFDEMSLAQKSDLEAKAAAAGKSVGAFIRGEASARGYGGFAAVWWPALTPPEKAAWTARFNAVLTRVKSAAPQELQRIISSAEAAGGGVFFLPQELEELGPSAYAFRQGNKLGVGKLWVETAENNPPDVFENIAHELGGHLDYGATASWDIMKGTLAAIPPAEKTIAESGPRHLYSAYQYMETEIYAELRELPYRTPGSRGDEPEGDVETQLQNLKDAFEARVAEAIVRGMRRRIQLDSRITGAARDLFDQKVKTVFGITF